MIVNIKTIVPALVKNELPIPSRRLIADV